MDLLLNGEWEVGLDRAYDRAAPVPGIATDPAAMDEAPLWYKRTVDLPGGDWTDATLILKGARFRPTVYVDGVKVHEIEGGMAPTVHPLRSEAIRPGATITLEIALTPLNQMPEEDASRTPEADWWRSNVSCCLWDDVVLHLHGPARIARLLPMPDLEKDELALSLLIAKDAGVAGDFELAVAIHPAKDTAATDGAEAADGPTLVEARQVVSGGTGLMRVPLKGALARWSPASPNCYRLVATLLREGRPIDRYETPLGLKDFRVVGKAFRLNGDPITLRAGSVVWHRFCRDAEGRTLAFNPAWWEENILKRLKSHGANTLRFHLGMPPEWILDLCDKHGLLVQAEWSFFHGLKGSMESLLLQWRDWLDLCHRHPSTAIVHAWNETEGEELEKAFSALEALAHEYPPMVVGHRDVIHVHKYWWSLFENVGCYYETADTFPQPIMVDEFGGNYLDGDCEPGGYPTLEESLLRFLGPKHTAESRLHLHTEANARIAEYWRRIGAAGFSPFCILGSWEDGNHHFLGELTDGAPKPVWHALTAAYAPVSVSLDLWDRNFAPSGRRVAPLHFFNETDEERLLAATVRLVREGNPEELWYETEVEALLPPYGHREEPVELVFPKRAGKWRAQAMLRTAPPGVEHSVLSEWRCWTIKPKCPKALAGKTVAVNHGEAELRAFLQANGVAVTAGLEGADILLTGRDSWEALDEVPTCLNQIEKALTRGTPVVMLDVGPRPLGQGYLEGGEAGPLQGAPVVAEPERVKVRLCWGLRAYFTTAPEPESCLHPAEAGCALWAGLHPEATWLWNGYKGGLTVPATDMTLGGISPSAFLEQWRARGLDPAKIETDHRYAYALGGYYAFAPEMNDETKAELRRRVRFLVEDAPALAREIDPEGTIDVYDLPEWLEHCRGAMAQTLTPLVRCGKGLHRTPVMEVTFQADPEAEREGAMGATLAAGGARLILSQVLTAGRLAPGFGTPGLYGVRQDPAAQQWTLNLLAHALA